MKQNYVILQDIHENVTEGNGKEEHFNFVSTPHRGTSLYYPS